MGFLSSQFAQKCVDQPRDCCPQVRRVCKEKVHEKRLCLHTGKVICTTCHKCKPRKIKGCCKQCCPKFPKVKKCC